MSFSLKVEVIIIYWQSTKTKIADKAPRIVGEWNGHWPRFLGQKPKVESDLKQLVPTLYPPSRQQAIDRESKHS